MSFLNPVNEPVLRFSSTDADAPQINYNARVAGDVKAVLKACLVTGYGATASAGWSIMNEVDHVAEFVSPSVDMSDYQVGVDDTSAYSTAWYYKYQDVRSDSSYLSAVARDFSYINRTHVSNGWDLLVTNRGFCFIERVFSTPISSLISRLTYYGQSKLAVNSVKNITMFCTGYSSQVSKPFETIKGTGLIFDVSGYAGFQLASTPVPIFNAAYTKFGSDINISGDIYFYSPGVVVAQLPGLLMQMASSRDRLLGIYPTTIDSRNAIYAAVGYAHPTASVVEREVFGFVVYLDYWEY